MLLTWYAFFDKGMTICLHNWPEVASLSILMAMVRASEWYLHMPSWSSLITYWACSAVTHLTSGWPYPRLYRSSPIIVYLAALASQPLSVLGVGLPVLRYWMYGVVQFSVWSRLRQMFIIDGTDNVRCRRDLCLLFNLVLASLDRISALTFSLLGMC